MATKYINVADTAKLVRAALREAFPGTKFSVRSKSYSGGASINVDWIDGPNASQVDAITFPFRGASFDPMQDLKTSTSAVLDGEAVHFAADFIFCCRNYSDEAVARAIARVGADATVEQFRRGQLWDVPFIHRNARGEFLQEVLHSLLAKNTSTMRVERSKTSERLAAPRPARPRLALVPCYAD